MGWAASAYQYGILATHWYWVGAIPAMTVLMSGNLHAGIWWGLLILAIGLFYCGHFQPRKTK